MKFALVTTDPAAFRAAFEMRLGGRCRNLEVFRTLAFALAWLRGLRP